MTSSGLPRDARQVAEPRGSQSNPDRIPDEQRFTVDDLAEGARAWLDESPHAVRGALSSQSRKTFTLPEAKQIVREFMEREAEVDPGRGV